MRAGAGRDSPRMGLRESAALALPNRATGRGSGQALPSRGDFLDWPGARSMMSPRLDRPGVLVLLANSDSPTLPKAPRTRPDPRDFARCVLDRSQALPGQK